MQHIHSHNWLILTARKKSKKGPPPHHPVKIKIEKVSPVKIKIEPVSPPRNIELIKKAHNLVGVQGQDYEVLLPSEMEQENDEETRQFLEHVAAQNAPDLCDFIEEEDVSLSSLQATPNGSLLLPLTRNETTMVAVAEAVPSIAPPGYKDPEPQVEDVVCPHCLECPCQWLRFGSSVRDYYADRLDTIGADNMPPNNVVRKQLYRQTAMMLGFIRREEHAWCVISGIRAILPSDEYMGHRWA
jgi:hypothetical protein